MKTYEATEQAYKNGYEKGKQDAMKQCAITREKLIELLADSEHMSYEKKADYLIANGVVISNLETTTFATDIKVGHWITKNGCTFCSECMTCGSPQWKVCPVCETKMDLERSKDNENHI